MGCVSARCRHARKRHICLQRTARLSGALVGAADAPRICRWRSIDAATYRHHGQVRRFACRGRQVEIDWRFDLAQCRISVYQRSINCANRLLAGHTVAWAWLNGITAQALRGGSGMPSSVVLATTDVDEFRAKLWDRRSGSMGSGNSGGAPSGTGVVRGIAVRHAAPCACTTREAWLTHPGGFCGKCIGDAAGCSLGWVGTIRGDIPGPGVART